MTSYSILSYKRYVNFKILFWSNLVFAQQNTYFRPFHCQFQQLIKYTNLRTYYRREANFLACLLNTSLQRYPSGQQSVSPVQFTKHVTEEKDFNLSFIKFKRSPSEEISSFVSNSRNQRKKFPCEDRHSLSPHPTLFFLRPERWHYSFRTCHIPFDVARVMVYVLFFFVPFVNDIFGIYKVLNQANQ